MHTGPYPATLAPRDKKPSHSSSEETSSEFDLLEIKIKRKQKYKGKAEQVLYRHISYYNPPLVGLQISDQSFFPLHWCRDIYRRYFLRNIPIISLAYYKEKIEIYTKYLEKKSNRVCGKYLRLHRWISQAKVYFAADFTAAKFSHLISQL